MLPTVCRFGRGAESSHVDDEILRVSTLQVQVGSVRGYDSSHGCLLTASRRGERREVCIAFSSIVICLSNASARQFGSSLPRVSSQITKYFTSIVAIHGTFTRRKPT
jgi:hypothetical protein